MDRQTSNCCTLHFLLDAASVKMYLHNAGLESIPCLWSSWAGTALWCCHSNMNFVFTFYSADKKEFFGDCKT